MTETSPITAHVLDALSGRPAPGVRVALYSLAHPSAPLHLGSAETDSDGRVKTILAHLLENRPQRGVYKAVFDVGEYWEKKGQATFYPRIIFQIENPSEHYHIPLLLSPASYTTYRGS